MIARRAMFVAVLLIITVFPTMAQDDGLGLGVMIGDWSGVTGKYWVSSGMAVGFGVGAQVGPTTVNASGDKENSGTIVRIYGDFLLHSPDAIQSTEEFPVHYGLGAYLNTGGLGDDEFGARLVLGLAYQVQQAPLDLYFDLVPYLQLDPSVGFGLAAVVGMRYFP